MDLGAVWSFLLFSLVALLFTHHSSSFIEEYFFYFIRHSYFHINTISTLWISSQNQIPTDIAHSLNQIPTNIFVSYSVTS